MTSLKQDISFGCFYHVPDEVGDPVDKGSHPTDVLQVLGFGGPFNDQEDHKASWHKGHGHDDEDGNDDIGGLTIAVNRRHMGEFCVTFTTN